MAELDTVQARIAILEAFLSSTDSLYPSAGGNGASVSRMSRKDASAELQMLYARELRLRGNNKRFARVQITGGPNP
jgi:hypothetical protein